MTTTAKMAAAAVASAAVSAKRHCGAGDRKDTERNARRQRNDGLARDDPSA